MPISNPSFLSLHSAQQQHEREETTAAAANGLTAGQPQDVRQQDEPQSLVATVPSTSGGSGGDEGMMVAALSRLWLLFAPNGVPYKVLLGVPAIRLLLVPAISVLIFHFVWLPLGLVSRDDSTAPGGSYKLTWLVLLVEFTAPSAMNTAVLCSLANYIPTTASKLIFYQYSLSAVTMVMWLIFALWYIG
jgi:hypothetical protein